jgi:GINS complex subunit 3
MEESNNYFSIKDIMASQERVSCKFEVDVLQLGYLDTSSNEVDLKSGTKLDLPSWLVKSIYNEKFKFIQIEIPKQYKRVYHEILQADPNVVDLRKLGPYYYDFGTILVEFNHLLSQDIARILLWVI